MKFSIFKRLDFELFEYQCIAYILSILCKLYNLQNSKQLVSASSAKLRIISQLFFEKIVNPSAYPCFTADCHIKKPISANSSIFMSVSTNLKCTRASAALKDKENKGCLYSHAKFPAKFSAIDQKQSNSLKFQNSHEESQTAPLNLRSKEKRQPRDKSHAEQGTRQRDSVTEAATTERGQRQMSKVLRDCIGLSRVNSDLKRDASHLQIEVSDLNNNRSQFQSKNTADQQKSTVQQIKSEGQNKSVKQVKSKHCLAPSNKAQSSCISTPKPADEPIHFGNTNSANDPNAKQNNINSVHQQLSIPFQKNYSSHKKCKQGGAVVCLQSCCQIGSSTTNANLLLSSTACKPGQNCFTSPISTSALTPGPFPQDHDTDCGGTMLPNSGTVLSKQHNFTQISLAPETKHVHEQNSSSQLKQFQAAQMNPNLQLGQQSALQNHNGTLRPSRRHQKKQQPATVSQFIEDVTMAPEDDEQAAADQSEQPQVPQQPAVTPDTSGGLPVDCKQSSSQNIMKAKQQLTDGLDTSSDANQLQAQPNQTKLFRALGHGGASGLNEVDSGGGRGELLGGVGLPAGRRMTSAVSTRFKRTGHVYVQRHSNKKNRAAVDRFMEADANQHELQESCKKQYCDIGDKQLPDKFLSPHSDNEDYIPAEQVDQIKLFKKFNPSDLNMESDDQQNQRAKENSLLSEAINAVNIQSSILSNEQINLARGESVRQRNNYNQSKKQEGSQIREFKSPLQVKRLDSNFTRQLGRLKHRMYSFGGSARESKDQSFACQSQEPKQPRQNLDQITLSAANEAQRKNSHCCYNSEQDHNNINLQATINQSMFVAGQDNDCLNSEIDGPNEEDLNQKRSTNQNDRDKLLNANESMCDNQFDDENNSLFKDQLEGTDGGQNTANYLNDSVIDQNDVKYNRKDMSLGKLCRKFLKIYGKEQKGQLLLDQCTQELGVERRRIYDIINILESFSVIRRQAKNSYYWRGIDQIINSIQSQINKSQQSLQMQALSLKTKSKSVVAQSRDRYRLQQEKENLGNNGQQVELQRQDEEALNSFDLLNDNQSAALSKPAPNIKDSENASVSMATSYLPNHIDLQSDDEEDDEILKQMQKMNGGRVKKYKKDKSLGILCQNFIHLFVTWQPVISLEEAAKKINERQEDMNINKKEQKLKTKIRRLYDIANVLSSLGLIEKCQAINSKKPAFKWIGLEGTIKSLNDLKDEPLNSPRNNGNHELSQNFISNFEIGFSGNKNKVTNDVTQQKSETSYKQNIDSISLNQIVNKFTVQEQNYKTKQSVEQNGPNLLKRPSKQESEIERVLNAVISGGKDIDNNYYQLDKDSFKINKYCEQLLNKNKQAIVDYQISGSIQQIGLTSKIVESDQKLIQNQDITDQIKTRMNTTNSSTMQNQHPKTGSVKGMAHRPICKPRQYTEGVNAGTSTPEAASSNQLLKKRQGPSSTTVRRPQNQTNGSQSSQIMDAVSTLEQINSKTVKRSQRLRTEQLECPQKAELNVEDQNTQATVKADLKLQPKRLNANLTQIINEIDQKEPHDYSVMKNWLECCEKSQDSSHNGNSNMPHKFINEDEENEIVRQVQSQQRHLMEIDPLGELDVALMDRNTARKSIYHEIINHHPTAGNHANQVEGRTGGKTNKNWAISETTQKHDKSADHNDQKQQEQGKKNHRPVQNKNNNLTEENISQTSSDKQSRKKSLKNQGATQTSQNKRQAKQAQKGQLSHPASPTEQHEPTISSSQKRDEDIQISGKGNRQDQNNAEELPDKKQGADSMLTDVKTLSEITSVKPSRDHHQSNFKKSTLHSELLFGFGHNLWKNPGMDRKVGKLNSGSSDWKAAGNLSSFEQHTSKMICLSSMIDFTYQMEWYRRQRETLFGLFKDLACQQTQ